MQQHWLAPVFIGLSRAAAAVSSVLNMAQLLRNVSDAYRGRVFSANESITWAVMMVAIMAAGVALQHYAVRTIGFWSGVLSLTTALARDL